MKWVILGIWSASTKLIPNSPLCFYLFNLQSVKKVQGSFKLLGRSLGGSVEYSNLQRKEEKFDLREWVLGI